MVRFRIPLFLIVFVPIPFLRIPVFHEINSLLILIFLFSFFFRGFIFSGLILFLILIFYPDESMF